MLLGFRQSPGLFMTDNQVDQGEEGISGEGILQMEKKKDLFCGLIFAGKVACCLLFSFFCTLDGELAYFIILFIYAPW